MLRTDSNPADKNLFKSHTGIAHTNYMHLFWRIGVVVCSISATVYYGGLCTEKYISNPATVVEEMVPLDQLPPLQWSICRQVYFADCFSYSYLDLWSYDYVETG